MEWQVPGNNYQLPGLMCICKLRSKPLQLYRADAAPKLYKATLHTSHALWRVFFLWMAMELPLGNTVVSTPWWRQYTL